jgi:hypothetical protein
MSVRIVTASKKPSETTTYFARVVEAFRAARLTVPWHTAEDWNNGKVSAHPAHDVVVADVLTAGAISSEYGVVGVMFGSAMETALRRSDPKMLDAARKQRAFAARPKHFTVATSDWVALAAKAHTSILADRIIYPSVDTDTYFPSERQRLRNAAPATVFHSCDDAALVEALGHAMPDTMTLQRLDRPTADELRGGDIYLSLDAAGEHPSTVSDALASGLIVVGTNTGVLWALDGGEPVALCGGAATAWVDFKANTAVFDWQFRAWPNVVVEALAHAWRLRTHFCCPNAHVLRWLSLDTFGQKWIEALSVAMPRFGIKDAPPRPVPPVVKKAKRPPGPPKPAKPAGRTIRTRTRARGRGRGRD